MIAFIDTEVSMNGKVLDIGAIRGDGSTFHKGSLPEFQEFVKGAEFICGHNILKHDLCYLGASLQQAGINQRNAIDTLVLSPLLFPTRPYHALLKDDKLQTDEMNNPLNDAIKARDLFHDEVSAIKLLDPQLQNIFYLLLWNTEEFQAFFRCIGFADSMKGQSGFTSSGPTGAGTTLHPLNGEAHLASLIQETFRFKICQNCDLNGIIADHPVELAYCLALIHANNRYSITPPWVLRNYPVVEQLMFRLCSKPCIYGCSYCDTAWDIHLGLKRYFGYDGFRTFGGEPLQEQAVQAAVNNHSLLAVFPTGGGKSITFQVPALMAGENAKGLTVVISPLQSLMKDQVDNLEKMGITDAVTINGLLDPIERAKSFERVENGSACMLYISPESLRSRSIEQLLLGRKIARFVIDEAHCFSAWGQDFRVDYLYIGDFIQSIQQKKKLQGKIPISCFTATAKQKVIEDIRTYFQKKLSLELMLFTSTASRTNLHFKVFAKQADDEKYQMVRDLLIERDCPTIIYVSRTKNAVTLAQRLTSDGFPSRPYHGKMDAKEKTTNQNDFIAGNVRTMVATSAFGMGVDKKDVGMVIHYEISDSLENYIQEAGRAGRDEHIEADCFVLFNEEDLNKHFILLNQTKLSIKEIQQIWKAIKEITKFRTTVSNSALEIARKAGWDDNVVEIETRVTTAVAALEEAGYLKRGQNMPRVFANSICSKNAQEAIDKIMVSDKFEEKQKEKGVRIIKRLFSSKSKLQATDEEAEARIDYISDHLGIVKEEVINIVHLLREEGILADAKDLTAYIKRGESHNRSLQILESFNQLERFLLPTIEEQEKTIHLKELNESAAQKGLKDISPHTIKTVLNFWAIKNWIKRSNLSYSQNHLVVLALQPTAVLKEKQERRHALARFIVEHLYEKSALLLPSSDQVDPRDVLVDFSVHELKESFENSIASFGQKVTPYDVEDALFYLSRIEAVKIEGGFMVVYNRLTIERLEDDNHKRYTKDDYQKLHQFYENKVQQIHIVGEYAHKMLADYKDALQFVEDYFQLNYSVFLRKYFPGSKAEDLKLKMTRQKFNQLFEMLSPTQLKIIHDHESRYMVVVAGPGSGKTRVLVHKLAALLLMEDVKHEQLLMLTFSRAAVTEFKKRLLELVGNAANFVEIKTFHSYCFDLLGRVGSLEKSDEILKIAVEKIVSGEVEVNRITKAVLVIDEAQDMDKYEFQLVKTLMEYNEEMRVIAVGDDDQNIYEFRGSSSQYLETFIRDHKATKHELLENFRSKRNLVAIANQFAESIHHRLKTTPIISHQSDNGRIEIISYRSNHLITPLVETIAAADLSGTTCVLTTHNAQAEQIAGMLLRNGIHAQLIQSNDRFDLYNLLEIRFFLAQLNLGGDNFVIHPDEWTMAKKELVHKFRNSSQLSVCLNLIRDFEQTNPKTRYKSDLLVFIRESKLEDFFNPNGETIFVSTIHKAKGKEFDNVFLLLDNFFLDTDEKKRQLYVGMTRAKRCLNIHLNLNILDHLVAEDLYRISNHETYLPPEKMALHLSHRDLQLDYFITRQSAISQLMSGEELILGSAECMNSRGASVLRFSNQFLNTIASKKQQGYFPQKCNVNFIVFWRKEGSEQEVKIILPVLYFEKRQ